MASRLRLARETAGLKKVELARKTGLSLSYVGRLENGKGRPSGLALKVLATALGVSANWLVSGKGQMASSGTPTTGEGLSPLKSGSAYQVELAMYLSGTSLEGVLGQLSARTRRSWEIVWTEMSEQTKNEVRRNIRTLVNAALVLEHLPQELATPLFDEFKKHLRAYLRRTFEAPRR